MSISGIDTGYLSQMAQSAADNSSAAKRATERDYSKSTDAEMLDACKKFEAYFIEQVLKEVKKTIPENEEMDGPTSNLVDYFKDNMIQEFSAKIQETSGIGLAQQMFEQMKRNYSNVVPASEVVKSDGEGADATDTEDSGKAEGQISI